MSPATTEGNGPLSKALLEYKKLHGLTFLEMQDKLGMSKAVLFRIVHEGETDDLRIMKRLARIFEWSAEDLGVALMHEPEPRKKPRGYKYQK